MTEKEAFTAFSSFVLLGPVRMTLLISYFGSAKEAWEATSGSLEKIGLGKGIVSKFLSHRKGFKLGEYIKSLKKLKIDIVTKDEKNYPKSLAEIDSAPLLLYYKGRITNLDPAVAIVGSRNMSPYGREVTKEFARKLAELGISIISGLALGVDTEAHWGAIKSNGKTAAVCGCGLDIIYPPQNTKLADAIINSGGALISEYPLGYPPLKANFPARNRIISGVSKGVLVIEGAQKSGTLLTASAAADQGRTVFAVPGPIGSPTSAAPHFLIKNGAIPVTSPQDVLDEIGKELQQVKNSRFKARA